MRPARCLDCYEHGEPYDGPCDACGHYTAGIAKSGRRVVKHDGVTFLTTPPSSENGA